jgi:hypothetical protein
MELACPGEVCPDVKGVSILVHSGHPDAAGYSGIEISVRKRCGSRGATANLVAARGDDNTCSH